MKYKVALLKEIKKTPKEELIKKIAKKKEYSMLLSGDIEIALSQFFDKKISDKEKIKKTREILHKTYGAFLNEKILSFKEKSPEWVLKKHVSTRERFPFYKDIYKKILRGMPRKISVIDLGAGVNGFSYYYFRSLGYDVNYTAIDSIGQLIIATNNFFKKNKLYGKALHISLFNLEAIINTIKKEPEPRIIFLFKVIDSLENLKKNYVKELLIMISEFLDRAVLSFSTKSLGSGKKFFVNRAWLLNFIKENFIILDEFEISNEKFLIFKKR